MSVSLFLFSCSKGHSVRDYLDTTQMILSRTTHSADFFSFLSKEPLWSKKTAERKLLILLSVDSIIMSAMISIYFYHSWSCFEMAKGAKFYVGRFQFSCTLSQVMSVLWKSRESFAWEFFFTPLLCIVQLDVSSFFLSSSFLRRPRK